METRAPVATVDPVAPASLQYAVPVTEAQGTCYRCGYVLHGIADDQPCPECGLLAERSRRVSDELHDTRPRWLARIARAGRTSCCWRS